MSKAQILIIRRKNVLVDTIAAVTRTRVAFLQWLSHANLEQCSAAAVPEEYIVMTSALDHNHQKNEKTFHGYSVLLGI